MPTAAVALSVAQRSGVDLRAALERFYRVAPDWLARIDRGRDELRGDGRSGRIFDVELHKSPRWHVPV